MRQFYKLNEELRLDSEPEFFVVMIDRGKMNYTELNTGPRGRGRRAEERYYMKVA